MENKTLIAVVSARHRLHTWAQTIRDTWLPYVPIWKADVLFFVGRGEPMDIPEDTVELDCDDSYQGLPSKVQAISKWAKDHDYEYMLKCDDDVVMSPVEVLNSGYEKYPYSGHSNRLPNSRLACVVPMGFCYWLSKECMVFIENEPLPDNNDDEKWVAETLHKHGISLKDESRYHLYVGGLIDTNEKRVLRPNRPLNSLLYRPIPVEVFAWSIFLEGNSGLRIPIDIKLKEFKKVFAKYCQPRLAEYVTKP